MDCNSHSSVFSQIIQVNVSRNGHVYQFEKIQVFLSFSLSASEVLLVIMGLLSSITLEQELICQRICRLSTSFFILFVIFVIMDLFNSPFLSKELLVV